MSDNLAPDMVDLYVLRCPDTGDIRYAGKANDASKRLKTHLRESRRLTRPVNRWVKSLVDQGKSPLIEVVERVPVGAWESAEKALIARLRGNTAVKLLNLADGGAQPSQTVEQKQAAGRRSVKLREKDERTKRIHYLKMQMGMFLKKAEKNDHYYRMVEKLKLCAKKAPHLFGLWANL